MENKELLKIEHLKKYFKINVGFFETKILKAVDDITFTVNKNETFCIVGESGCGKSTLGRTILNLYKPTAGNIFFNNQKIDFKNKIEMQEFRKKTQIIFQDPLSSLDPSMTIKDIISEPLDIQNIYLNNTDKEKKIFELMDMVNLQKEYVNRYIHELSGGQRQRVCIARSLALNPELIICDEPISALDVSIQAQILNMFINLQKKFNLTYIFITHNLLVVKHIADRIAVMYLGHIVELANADDLFINPMHPYTLLLLNSIITHNSLKQIEGNIIYTKNNIPSPLNVPSGCPFRTRCDKAIDKCAITLPTLKEVKPNHFVACLLII